MVSGFWLFSPLSTNGNLHLQSRYPFPLAIRTIHITRSFNLTGKFEPSSFIMYNILEQTFDFCCGQIKLYSIPLEDHLNFEILQNSYWIIVGEMGKQSCAQLQDFPNPFSCSANQIDVQVNRWKLKFVSENEIRSTYFNKVFFIRFVP